MAKLGTLAEELIKQNNAIDIYEEYFAGERGGCLQGLGGLSSSSNSSATAVRRGRTS